MRTFVFAAVASIVALAPGACGPPGGEGSGSISFDEADDRIDDAIFTAECSAGFECAEKQTPSFVADISRYGDQSTCTSEISSRYGLSDNSEAKEAIDAGLVEYDGEAALDCVERVESYFDSNACVGIFSSGSLAYESCQKAYQGTQEKGEPCTRDEHCTTEHCDGEKNPDKCYGACAENPTEYVGAGSSCGVETDNVCDPESDLYCSRTDDSEGRVCVKPRSIGKGGSCSAGIVCSGELACVEAECAETTLHAEGDSCSRQDATDGCKPGLVCARDASGAATNQGTCTPPLEQGEECFTSTACKWNLYCDGAALDGQTPGTCEEKKSEGSDCGSPEECKPNLICDDGTCSSSDSGGGVSCEVPS